MMRRGLRQLVVVLGSLMLLGSTSGCQYAYPYELRGVVRSAADGNPLPGVSVMLKASGISEGTSFPVTTAPDGTFKASFRVADYQFVGSNVPEWSLVLCKDGYHDEAVDISPTQRPESPKTTTHVVVFGYMRPK